MACLLPLAADIPEVAWKKLGNLERSNPYTFVLRDGTCQTGKIRGVEETRIILESGAEVQKPNVLWVGEGMSPHEVLYSGRSSWSDVRHVEPGRLEALNVRLKSGKSMQGPVVTASESQITIKHYGRSVRIAKDEVAEVEYVRFKPVSEAHRYFAQEAAGLQLLDPKAWQYLLRIDALLPVRLYDASMPEDNSPLKCDHDSSKR